MRRKPKAMPDTKIPTKKPPKRVVHDAIKPCADGRCVVCFVDHITPGPCRCCGKDKRAR